MRGNMKTVVIYNPAAGIKGDNPIDKIITHLEQRQQNYTIYETEIHRGPIEILKDIQYSFDCLVVSGGDGTVSDAVQGLHNLDLKIPLLIIPSGTTNDIAANIGMSHDTNTILETLENSKIRSIDFGLIDGKTCFTYSLTFGNFTEVTYKTPQQLKNWMGYKAYVLYGFLTFRRIKIFKLQIETDSKSFDGDFVFGGVTNSKSVGNIFFFKDDVVSLDDGLFEVLLIRRPRSIKHLRMILNGLISHDYNNEMFVLLKTKSIQFSGDRKIDWNIDGEFGGSLKSITAINQHKGLQIYSE